MKAFLLFLVVLANSLNAQPTNSFEPSLPGQFYFHLYMPGEFPPAGSPPVLDEVVNFSVLLGKDYCIQPTNSWVVTDLTIRAEVRSKQLFLKANIRDGQGCTFKFDDKIGICRFYAPSPDLTDTNIVALPILFVVSTNAGWKPGTNWWRELYKRD
jgi:hypothetical protein